MPPRPASIKVRALQWLAQREHSRSELRDKLLRLLQRRPQPAPAADVHADADGHAPATSLGADAAEPPDPTLEVDALLDWLEAHGHLSQSRFVESRVHAREARYGNRRIQQELQQHGVVLDADAKQALQRSEFERAQGVWRKKFGSPALDATARVRQLRFLAGRGFSMAVVQRVVREGAAAPDGVDDSAA